MRTSPFTFSEVEDVTGVKQTELQTWIENEWLSPLEPDALDHQDLARVRLIQDLRFDFGTNDESIPIILHLVDQLYRLQNQIDLLK